MAKNVRTNVRPILIDPSANETLFWPSSLTTLDSFSVPKYVRAESLPRRDSGRVAQNFASALAKPVWLLLLFGGDMLSGTRVMSTEVKRREKDRREGENGKKRWNEQQRDPQSNARPDEPR
jgi:hypothetical protein